MFLETKINFLKQNYKIRETVRSICTVKINSIIVTSVKMKA